MISPALIGMFAAARLTAAPPPPPAPGYPGMVLVHADTDLANTATGGYAIDAFETAVTTAQSKFGGGSATGTTGFGGDLTATVTPNVTFSGDWVVDCWARDAFGNIRVRHPDTNQEWNVSVSAGGSSLSRLDALGDPVYEVAGSGALGAGAWTHIELSRVSGVVRLFVGGVLSASQSDTTSLTVAQVVVYGEPFLDEWRVVNGAGGHTSNFTPPTAPYA